MKLLIALSAMLMATSVYATPDAVVSGVKMPAWVERGMQRLPLSSGMELSNGDILLTGQNSRVLLKTADGSDIKLGEHAKMQLTGLAQQRDGQPLFTAALNVVKGAFRFTTSAIAKLYGREVSVRVAGATIGIRGTDVWGKVAETDQDIVLLIEGKISVSYRNEPAFVMDEPLSLYKMPKDAAPFPIAKVDLEQLKKWAAETEIAAGQGATSTGGKWKVDLKTCAGEAATLLAYDELRAAGYDVRILPLRGNKFRVRILQLPDREAAETLAHELAGKMGIESPAVSR